jgi:hypothetical protein
MHTFNGVLLSCFLPDCVRELVIAVRADKRERRDPIGFFLFDRLSVDDLFIFTEELAADTNTRFEFDKINELFSLSLELRSIDAVRVAVDVVLSNKTRGKKSRESHKIFSY